MMAPIITKGGTSCLKIVFILCLIYLYGCANINYWNTTPTPWNSYSEYKTAIKEKARNSHQEVLFDKVKLPYNFSNEESSYLEWLDDILRINSVNSSNFASHDKTTFEYSVNLQKELYELIKNRNEIPTLFMTANDSISQAFYHASESAKHLEEVGPDRPSDQVTTSHLKQFTESFKE